MTAFRKSLGIISFLSLLALPLVAWWKFQAINDWWRLRDYVPPLEVVQMANADTMTDSARRIFYVNHPKIYKQIEEFRKDCSQSEQTIVLGCYRPPQQGIAIYDINDPRLNGVKEVTAAHEMLHAAYDRLSDDEKDRINGLLKSFYAQQNDPRIEETVNLYKQTEPKEVVNEMHSIFGTEIAALPSELENYYKRYLSDRSTVVRLAQGYEKEFSSRLAQIKQYDLQMASLKLQTDEQETSLEAQLKQIEADKERLNNLRSSGRIDEYNALVPIFNARVNAYNQGVAKLRRNIDSYNGLVARRNEIASELRSLDSALDTRLTTQSAR